MSGVLERINAPGQRAMRGAGPPPIPTAVAIVGGVALAGVIWLVRYEDGPPWLAFGLIPGTLTAALAVADRDGWRIRAAIATVGLEQVRRWGGAGSMPRTVAAAERWLADPARADEPPLRRVSVMTVAGRWDAARAALMGIEPRDDIERASRMRLLAVIDGRAAGRIDEAPVRAELDALDLPPAERRYQRLSLAWSQAWLDIVARRPWRRPFADAIRGLGPFALPARVRLIIAIQQLAAPIACVLAVAIMAMVYGG